MNRTHTRFFAFCLFVSAFFGGHNAIAQSFLNGDFETNTCPANVDQINLSNSAFNAYVPNVVSFGTYGDLDMITTNTYSGGPEHGLWNTALTGGGTDMFSLAMTSNLIAGHSYTISFYDKAGASWTPAHIELGVSNSSTAFGTLVYTTTALAAVGVWTQRTCTFTSPSNASYVTVQTDGALANWTLVDNFSFPCAVNVFLGNDTTLCNGQSLTLNATYSGGTYHWNTGATTATISVSATGYYSVTVTDTCGSAIDTIHVSFLPPPVANAGVNDTLCSGTSVLLQASGGVNYHWSPSLGLSNVNISNPLASPTNTTLYTVTVSVGSCTSTATVNVLVVPSPHASFTADTMIGCNLLTVNFTNHSTGATSYTWYFGDGNQSTSTNPSHTYGPGTYNVILMAHGLYGCENDTTIAHLVTVIANPTIFPSFTASPTTGCRPMVSHFNNTSNIGTSWAWDFGDGHTDTARNPIHTYDTVGHFLVYLVVTDSNICGISSATFTRWDTIYAPPVNHFTATPMTACTPDTVSFINTSTGGNSYAWTFGTMSGSSTAPNPTYVYTTGGSYVVTLITTGDGGCTDTTHLTVTVNQSQTVVSAFTASPQSGCGPLTVNFTNTSTNATSTLWKFGDNNTNTATNTTHTYSTPGTYTVKLYSTNTSVCGTVVDSSTTTIVVNPYAQDSFTFSPTTGCTPLTVTFTNLSTNANSYHWSFGDTFTSTLTSPTHTYTAAGTDTITMIAFGAGGCNDTLKLPIVINQTQTVASHFTASPLSGCAPLTVNFTNTSTNATNTLWRFGDTNTSTATSPSHTYNNAGSYLVKLYSTNTSVCGTVVDSSTVTIVVNAYAHDTFTVSPSTGCTPQLVTFTNLSTNATSYHWDFGDISTSTSVSPTHTYTTAGTYSVTMIAYGAGGCNDTMIFSSITIQGAPVTTSAFTPTANIQACDSITVQFTNGSSNAMAYHWDFGDTHTSTSTNPSHTYNTSGTYTVVLIAYDTTVCGVASDTSRHISQITINPSSHAAFPDSNFVGCDNLTILFGNTSTNGINYLWDFGDGNTSNIGNPTHSYTTPGVYEVTLIAYGAGGCNDTLVNQDTVTIINTHIQSAFVADTFSGCSPFTVHFTNHSVNGITYLWEFGDGSTSTTTNASHTYTDSGSYTVKLYAYHNTNSPCGILIDSSFLIPNISVDTPILPRSIFKADSISGCSPFTVIFVDSSKDYNHFFWNFGNGSFDTLINHSIEQTYTYHAGTYTVTMITSFLNKCHTAPDTMKMDITVDTCSLFITNVFTPNSDGRNDLFRFEADGYSNYHLEIFDRWGLKVFESSDTKIQWNGKINNNGGDAPDGTYYYIFTSIDFNQKPFMTHGYFTLIR